MATIKEIREIAARRFAEYRLEDWKFILSPQSTNRFGYCSSARRVIALNPLLVSVNTTERCEKTILHEIAHAVVGTVNGHNEVWKAQMVRMGLKPDRCFQFDGQNSIAGAAKWLFKCPVCSREYKSNRVSPRAIYRCKLPCGTILQPLENTERKAASNAAKLGISAYLDLSDLL